MNDAKTFKLVASSLREIAETAATNLRRENALSLAEFFNRLAGDAEEEQKRETDKLFGASRSRVSG